MSKRKNASKLDRVPGLGIRQGALLRCIPRWDYEKYHLCHVLGRLCSSSRCIIHGPCMVEETGFCPDSPSPRDITSDALWYKDSHNKQQFTNVYTNPRHPQKCQRHQKTLARSRITWYSTGMCGNNSSCVRTTVMSNSTRTYNACCLSIMNFVCASPMLIHHSICHAELPE